MGKPVPPPPPPTVNGWYAGPIIGTLNYSKNITLQPLAGGVLEFALTTGSEIDALCKAIAVLPSAMTIAYTLSAPVAPSDFPSSDPLISIAFQRRGDNWSGRNQYQQYRWYAQASNILAPGSGTFTVDFNSLAWSDVYGIPASTHPTEFAAAKAEVETVYITFGHSSGRSHGVIGTAQFQLTQSTL